MAAIIHPLLILLASLTRQELISIVSYSTFRKWVRSVEDVPDKRPKPKDANPGCPRVEESISEAMIRIRKETGWRVIVPYRRRVEPSLANA